ncbi:S8 family serine peptidase [Longispora urticae]
MRRTLLAFAIPLLLAVPATASAAPADQGERHKYIVVLDSAAGDPAAFARTVATTTPDHVYRHALRGFSAPLGAATVRALRADPRVASVEAVQQVRTTAQVVPTGIGRSLTTANPRLAVGDGVDTRVDVDVAVIDTGVTSQNPDLNVVARTNCLNSTSCTDGTGEDGHGHGSHVAGTIAAIDNGDGVVGVAPGARVWSVRVLNDSGSGGNDGVVAGIDWVTAHADEIEAANMSLGCECSSPAMDAAVTRAVDAGIVMVVAAGNNHKDARTFSPANHPDVITVSALTDYDGRSGGLGTAPSSCSRGNDDTLANYSNFGPLVEIAAPGSCIYSTYKGAGYATLSGTSMATPHVTGAVAWLTSNGNDPKNRADVNRIRDALVTAGNLNWTDDSGDGIKEPLLDLSDQAVFPPAAPDPGAPTARATGTCSIDNNTCAFDGRGSSDPDGTITAWSWAFGDGTTGTGATPTHTYPAAGYYSAILTVTDNAGKQARTRTLVKAGNLPPVAVINRFPNAPCSGPGACTFDAVGSSDPEGQPLTYRWDFGDGTSSTAARVSHLYPAVAATYTVTLKVTDHKGLTSTDTVTMSCRKFFDKPWC